MSPVRVRARAVGTQRLELGESARWDAVTRRVSWVDVEKGRLYAAPPGAWDEIAQLHQAPTSLSCALPDGSGGFVLAEGTRVARLAAEGTIERGAELFPDDGVRRLNDGRLDPDGRVIVGTLSRGRDEPHEQLLRIEPDGRTTVLREGVRLSNGVAFHPDGRLHHVDSLARTVSWCDYRRDPLRWITAFRVDDGLPDGLWIDSAGGVWVAAWGAGEVRRHRDDGRVDRIVELDAPHVTSCVLVDERTLVITTAREGLDAGQLARHPASGSVFVAEL